jgi:hypothetical protein
VKSPALVVLLENVGHVHGIPLPGWAMDTIDFVTEEYAKFLLWWHGAYRRYARVVILEDARATGPELRAALLELSRAHTVDIFLLVHGRPGALVGYRAQVDVGPETFTPLLAAYAEDRAVLDLRVVYGVNCFGASLAPVWLALGARAVNGAVGVNWLPEPSLSIFLRNWLRGRTFADAVLRSHRAAIRWGGRLWRPGCDGGDHPKLAGSRQAIFGVCDVTITSR